VTGACSAIAGVPFDEYQAWQAVHVTNLLAMRISPRHYKHQLDNQKEPTPAMVLGSACHVAVLEPDVLPIRYAVWKGDKRQKKEWAAFQDAHEGETIITEDQYLTALAMRDSARSHPVAGPLLTGILAEVSVTWTDPATGLRCKGRIDGIPKPEGILDLKTTSKGLDLRSFAGHAARSGWIMQVAWYRRGWLLANHRDPGEELPCYILGVESAAPHDCCVYRLTEDALYFGLQAVDRLLARLAECVRTDEWPGAYPEAVELNLPPWAIEDGAVADPEWMTEEGVINA
jgi:hypothetical protein